MRFALGRTECDSEGEMSWIATHLVRPKLHASVTPHTLSA